MPLGLTTTRESSSPAKRSCRQRRKSTIWTREKIHRLIDLYRGSDCLWNHYSVLYKNKDCRNKAIDNICTSLDITKNDYKKKVHNLRNQFNSELKKYERRVEETEDQKSIAVKACRWEHFETLMFLRPIIEPRPGYQPQAKKLPRNLEYTFTDSHSDTQTTVAAKSQLDEVVKLQITNVTGARSSCVKDQSTFDPQLSQKAEATPNIPSATSPLCETQCISVPAPSNVMRDQWDAFGELIASEFRNLNSALSRKKLKRKIMQVMLEVGEEDDQNYTSAN